MIDINTAVQTVVDYLDAIGRVGPTGEPRLEEFAYDPDLEMWSLTFSFDDPFGAQRTYRTFEIDDNRRVLSMKITPLQRAS